MSELKHLLSDIELLRKNLYDLLEVKSYDLQDREIIAASEILNAAIQQYNQLITRKL